MPVPKPILALVHGWGMNARVFDPLIERLRGEFELRALNLPGHGGRPCLADNSLQSWGNDVARQLAPDTILLGWSLGGQVAMRAALDHPRRVARLVLLASTPRFVAAADWEHGMAVADLKDVGGALLADPRATLLRFLALQTRGAAGQKALLQQLRQILVTAPAPDGGALSAGLRILQETDLRDEVAQLHQPVLVLHGALDTLTRAGGGAWLAGALPDARHVQLAHAAHAPHLSHSAEVAAVIVGMAYD